MNRSSHIDQAENKILMDTIATSQLRKMDNPMDRDENKKGAFVMNVD
jgi:hypothetical protein